MLSAPIEWVEESEMTGGELMPAYIDEGGELLGPDGFDVDGENVYILNTADNSAYVYADGELERQISLDVTGLYAIRMAVEDGNVYIFGVEQDTRMPGLCRRVRGRHGREPALYGTTEQRSRGLHNGGERETARRGRGQILELRPRGPRGKREIDRRIYDRRRHDVVLAA